MTCIIATCSNMPRMPIAIDAAAMTAGPMRNRTAIPKAAMELPHAIILGCNAIKRPGCMHTGSCNHEDFF